MLIRNADLSIWNVETGHIISKFRLSDKSETKKKPQTSVSSSAEARVRGNTIARDQNAGLSFIGDADAGAGAITAMCFDDGGRRLITGSHDGSSIQMWNFSNGCLPPG